MSYLIFCSFEVGALPYKMAETLNRHGVKAYYISVAQNSFDHNSTRFHYGKTQDHWDLSSLFEGQRDGRKYVKLLRDIKSRYSIKSALGIGGKSYILGRAGIDYRYWSYGADLDPWCRFPVVPPEFPMWKKVLLYPYYFITVCRRHRKSLFNAGSLMIGPHRLKIYRELCPGKRLYFISQLISVTGSYEELCRKKRENKERICRTIGAERFFFSPVRHVWTKKNLSFAHNNKGNDIILYSFKRYLDVSKDKGAKLVMIKKGPDVAESKKLIKDLGIHDYAVWLDEMRRDELWGYYQAASMCLGQFGTPVLSYGALEPLANATPSVSFFEKWNDEIPFYETVPPVFSSMSPGEIADHMVKIVSDKEYASDLSRRSWLWAIENCSEERFVETFLNEMNR